MTDNRWQKLQEIFDDVLKIPKSERPLYLNKACADDKALRHEVEALVESHESSSDFLKSTVGIHAYNEFIQAQTKHYIGEQVGSYRIVRELGRGGMGAVYLAERADDQFRKQVAVKFVQPGLGPDQISKFHRERQILAQLSHPNIAGLIDGGTTPTGIPYLVMEYIAGHPIDEYCDAKKLSVEQRLELFRTVCSALQYAHQNLIVHLDIKPSNILVTEDGIPKLLDFGISKLLNPESLLQPAERTVTVLRRMTPEYASPEQIRSEPLNISSDIYSMGVLLYALLTSYLPYRFKNRDTVEIVKAVCEDEPERPSSAITRTVVLNGVISQPIHELRKTTPEKLHRQLSGDLDNILMMALRKEQARRYPSIDHFSEDIRRHLEGLPVSARKDTIRYRSAKFISRNKAGVTAAILIIISLIAGIIATTWQARIARDQRDRAMLEAKKAAQINAFVQNMLSSADPEVSGKDVTIAQILQQASSRVDSELKGQPEIASEVKTTLARTYMGLGLYDKAEPLYRSALEIRTKLYSADGTEVALGLNNLAQAVEYQGDLTSAEPMFWKSVETLRKIHGDENENVALVLNNLGELMLTKGDLKQAEELHRKELSIREKIFSHDSYEVAESINDLGVVLGTAGKYAEAEKLHRETLRIIRKIRGKDHLDLAAALSSTASLISEHNPVEAKKMFQESLAIREKKLGKEHPLSASTRYNYAYLEFDEGNYKEAEILLRQNLALRGKTLSDASSMTHSSIGLLGRVLSAEGDATNAQQYLIECVELRKKILPQGHWLIASAESALGENLAKLKRYDGAEKLLVASLKTLQETVGNDHQRTRETAQVLEHLYESTNQKDKAETIKKLALVPQQ